MRKYKYKREHFNSQEEYNRFRSNCTRWYKKWLCKHEQEFPEYRERRLLRQCLYSRYYRSDCRKSFCEWLVEEYGIVDIRTIPTEQLRAIVTNS